MRGEPGAPGAGWAGGPGPEVRVRTRPADGAVLTPVESRAAASPETVEAAYAHAARVMAHWAKSFHFAGWFLPRPKRRAIAAIYDYCRHADNLVDRRGSRPAADVRRELRELADSVRAMHAGGEPPVRWLALGDTMRRYRVPLEPLLELLDGVALDLDPVAMRDFPSLHEYCRLVAGGVGLMLGPVLGAAPDALEQHGVKLGVAMQLTNVLRDVAEDLDAGRVYLPADELARYGLSLADLERRRTTPALREFMRFQVDRARDYFTAGDAVVGAFPPDGSRLAVRLLQRTYAGILDAIEEMDYDVFRGRAYVSFPRKLAILGRALIRD